MVAPKEKGGCKVNVSQNVLSVLEAIKYHRCCCSGTDYLKSSDPK